MDVILLSRMLKELVMANDRVSLPGLGVFVCEYVPSSFSDRGFVINPPYRRIFFRSKKEDDSLLVSFYASQNNVDEITARRFVENLLVDLKHELDTKRVVEFPGLGKLRATKENTLFFVANQDLDIYPDGFGLSSVSLKSNEEIARKGEISSPRDVVMTIAPVPVSPPEVTVSELEKPRRHWIVYLCIVVGVLILACAVFAVLARLFPDSVFIDGLLYSEDELRLLEWARGTA